MYFEGKIKILGKIDVGGIKKSLLAIEDSVWEIESRRKDNKNFRDCQTIWLRLHMETLDNLLHTVNIIDRYNIEDFKIQCNKLVNQIEQIVGGSTIRASIIRLPSNQQIHRHMDGPYNIFKYCHRIVLPLMHNNTPYLYFDDDQFILEDGVLYDTNGYRPHWAKNDKDNYIYTAVFDILPKDETAVIIQDHPDTPKIWEWLREIGGKKKLRQLFGSDDWQIVMNNAKK